VRKDILFLPHDLDFLLIKSKKNITKLNSLPTKYFKKSTKIILEGKKPTRKNVVAIDNVL
jgi:hypothetical protein